MVGIPFSLPSFPSSSLFLGFTWVLVKLIIDMATAVCLVVNALCTLDTAYLIKYVGSFQEAGGAVQNPVSKIHLNFMCQLPLSDVTAMCIYFLCSTVFKLKEGKFRLNIQKNPSL